MTMDVSYEVLRVLAYTAMSAAWVISLRWLWLAATGKKRKASMGWRLPLAGLMLALAAVGRAIYRDVRIDPVEIVWETQLTQLAYLLLALALPFAIAAIESESSRP